MKIKKINYMNFRNFKEKGSIEFDTDDKVTIIYGVNGTGKTTMHQLLQWVLYGTVNFNASSNNNIFYNHEFEQEAPYNKYFSVYGEIEFEHENEQYSVRRTYKYYKDTLETKKVGEEFVVTKRQDDNNWNVLDNPEKIIEMVLPEGLKSYFFFDGERMIADLGKRGKESASQLKNAMYSILGLKIYENAVKHLGNAESTKTTVIGRLHAEKLKLGDSGDAQVIASQISLIEKDIEKLNKFIATKDAELSGNIEKIENLSEQIGATSKSNAQYERERQQLVKSAKTYEGIYDEGLLAFGQLLETDFSEAIISGTIERAKSFIQLKTEKDLLPEGLNLPLIEYILKRGKCICDRDLTKDEIAILEDYKLRVPPHSYKSIYNSYCQRLSDLSIDVLEKELVQAMFKVLHAKGEEDKCYKDIEQLDEDKKRDSSVQKYIQERNDLYDANNKLNVDLSKARAALLIHSNSKSKKEKEYTAATAGNQQVAQIDYKIKIAEQIKERYEHLLEERCEDYSKKLEKDIKQLLEVMLTSKRSVTVSKDFMFKVFDTFDDEAKSEGQFAVVSFAYIGGIFKLINEAAELNGMAYPLVLDGPFSKLDDEQRNNVIKTIPNYAQQVIILSKDDIGDYFDKDKVGKIYSIYSNEEKNVSKVIPGYSENYFETNGWRM